MFFSAAAFGLALASTVVSKTIEIQVGSANGTLQYSPDAVFADVGDQVIFTFHQKNHTATQSSLAAPCSPLEGGLDSGFMPVAANQTDGFPTYTVNVQNTNPMWFYCRQGENTPASHCGQGMVFAINCGADGSPNSFANFQQAALQIGAELRASAAASASAASSTSDSAATSVYTGPWTTADYGTATIPAAPPVSVVTETVTVASSVWTTTYSSYPGSPDPTPSSLTGNVIKVIVGGADGELTYTPNNVSASPRDIISFEFHQKNHTATQSSFAAPCVRLKDATTGDVIGLDSGFMPVDANATDFPVWNVTVNDTAPLWFYCRQHTPTGASHCGSGMVFAVNAVEDSPRNFSAFQALAVQLNGTTASNTSSSSGSSAGSAGSGAVTGAAFNAVLSLGALAGALAVLM